MEEKTLTDQDLEQLLEELGVGASPKPKTSNREEAIRELLTIEPSLPKRGFPWILFPLSVLASLALGFGAGYYYPKEDRALELIEKQVLPILAELHNQGVELIKLHDEPPPSLEEIIQPLEEPSDFSIAQEP